MGSVLLHSLFSLSLSSADPDYQNFVANMNAPASGADALPNAEAMLEEIEKKQKDSHGKVNLR